MGRMDAPQKGVRRAALEQGGYCKGLTTATQKLNRYYILLHNIKGIMGL